MKDLTTACHRLESKLETRTAQVETLLPLKEKVKELESGQSRISCSPMSAMPPCLLSCPAISTVLPLPLQPCPLLLLCLRAGATEGGAASRVNAAAPNQIPAEGENQPRARLSAGTYPSTRFPSRLFSRPLSRLRASAVYTHLPGSTVAVLSWVARIATERKRSPGGGAGCGDRPDGPGHTTS